MGNWSESERVALDKIARTTHPDFGMQVDVCLMWIARHMEPSGRINYRHDAYELKHVVERWVRETGAVGGGMYVSMAAFTQAAKFAGYQERYADDAVRFYANIKVAKRYTTEKL